MVGTGVRIWACKQKQPCRGILAYFDVYRWLMQGGSGDDFLSSDVQNALFARFIIVIIIAINTVRQHPRTG